MGLTPVFQEGKLSLRSRVGRDQTVSQGESHDHWLGHPASQPYQTCHHKSCRGREPKGPGLMERAPHWESTDLNSSPASTLTS